MTTDLSTPVPSTPGNDPANNATRLLTALHRRGGTATRAELTALLDCGRSAVSYALSDLVERGLVAVDERPPASATPGAASGRGRPSHVVTVAPTSPIAIAVHLRVDTLDVAAFELGGRILRIEREAVEPSPDVEMTMHRIGRLVRLIANEAQRPCIGIGVAMPSPVRATDGYALAPRHMNWPAIPARDLITQELSNTAFTSNSPTATPLTPSSVVLPKTAPLTPVSLTNTTPTLAGLPVHVGNDANLSRTR